MDSKTLQGICKRSIASTSIGLAKALLKFRGSLNVTFAN